MARKIYEIKLMHTLQPALTEEDAVDAFAASADAYEAISRDDVCVDVLVKEEDAVKLFTFARTMADADTFTPQELNATLRTLVWSLGYYSRLDEIVNCVLTWIERLEDADYSEFGEWLFAE